MTWLEMVKEVWVNASENEAEVLLWECTCFPFGDAGAVKEQLISLYERSNGSFSEALRIVDEEMADALNRHVFISALKGEYEQKYS